MQLSRTLVAQATLHHCLLVRHRDTHFETLQHRKEGHRRCVHALSRWALQENLVLKQANSAGSCKNFHIGLAHQSRPSTRASKSFRCRRAEQLSNAKKALACTGARQVQNWCNTSQGCARPQEISQVLGLAQLDLGQRTRHQAPRRGGQSRPAAQISSQVKGNPINATTECRKMHLKCHSCLPRCPKK